jgi:hypothetical protein
LVRRVFSSRVSGPLIFSLSRFSIFEKITGYQS